jgi:hypothetical protein
VSTSQGAFAHHSIIGIVLVGGALLALSTATRTVTGPVQRRGAESEARAWASGLGLRVDGVQCKDIDSDGDGNVSCTVAAGGRLHQIECPGALNVGHGCRAPKPTLNGAGERR